MPVRLIRRHVTLVARGFGQAFIKLALVGTGFWRIFATALSAFPAGLGVNFSYRPDRSILTPAYEILRGVGILREVFAGATRAVGRVSSAHQRVAFRVDGYLLERRRPNTAVIRGEPVG